MLPSWDAVVDAEGEAIPPAGQFTQPGGWPGAWGDGIQPDLLRRAVELQDMLHGPFSRMAGVATLAILMLCADEDVLRTTRRFLAQPAPPPPIDL